MSTLPPHDVPAVFWIDGAGQQQGPEPLSTVIYWVAHEQIPASTPVWWQGAPNWTPFNTSTDLNDALQAQFPPAPAPSPFSAPAPSESAAPFDTPAAFEAPATPMFGGPASADAGTAYEAPTAFQAPATFEAPAAVFEAPTAFQAPATFEAPLTYDAPIATVEPSVFLAPVSADVPVVSDVPEIIVPDAQPTYDLTATNGAAAEPAAPAGLQLGDPATLDADFAGLTERAAAFDAEVERAAALDDQLAAMVGQSVADLGFTVIDASPSDDYHSYRLSEPDGSSVSLAVQRVAPAYTVAAAVERPLACFVDRRRQVSVGVFLGDYLADDGSVDQALFTKHLASIINAAGTPA